MIGHERGLATAEFLHGLEQRQVRFAGGEVLHALTECREIRRQLGDEALDEAGFADAGFARDPDELALAGGRALVGEAQALEGGFAPDETSRRC